MKPVTDWGQYRRIPASVLRRDPPDDDERETKEKKERKKEKEPDDEREGGKPSQSPEQIDPSEPWPTS